MNKEYKVSRRVDECLELMISDMISIIKREENPVRSIKSIKENLGSIKTNESYSESTRNLIGTLFQLMSCSLCGNCLPTIQLNCQHFFCEKCFDNYLSSYQNLQKIPSLLKCPKCQSFIHTLQLEKMYEKITLLADDALSIQINNGNLIECISCSKKKPKKLYSEEYCCSYHKYCNECISKKYVSGDYKCNNCNIKFKGDPSNEKGICTSCRQEVYYVGDYLTTLCDDHTHCYNCLIKAQDDKICGTCMISLEEEDLNRIDSVLYKNCYFCAEKFENFLFLNKQCCKETVCIRCNINNPLSCNNCNQALNGYAVQQILDFESLIIEVANT